jgi:hypothetical protein
MNCHVKNCRFNNLHTTSGHKCGTCNKYGHGRGECGNTLLINDLMKYKDDKLPHRLQCTHGDCKWKWNHTTQGHHCHKCHKNHRSNDCIIKSQPDAERCYNINLEEKVRLLEDYSTTLNRQSNNYFTSQYMGMGCMLYIRLKNNTIDTLYMHSDNWGQYGVESDHSDLYYNFIRNSEEVFTPTITAPTTYKCPCCRSENSIDKAMKLKGNAEKCCACLERNIEIYSPECSHSVLCNECFMKLK